MKTIHNRNGEIICEITGENPVSHFAAGSDYEAIKAGAISISPITIHPGQHKDLSRYLQASFWTAVNKI
jgi:broad specificity polyphosphatase/5'/3'-nucleotidase SurE